MTHTPILPYLPPAIHRDPASTAPLPLEADPHRLHADGFPLDLAAWLFGSDVEEAGSPLTPGMTTTVHRGGFPHLSRGQAEEKMAARPGWTLLGYLREFNNWGDGFFLADTVGGTRILETGLGILPISSLPDRVHDWLLRQCRPADPQRAPLIDVSDRVAVVEPAPEEAKDARAREEPTVRVTLGVRPSPPPFDLDPGTLLWVRRAESTWIIVRFDRWLTTGRALVATPVWPNSWYGHMVLPPGAVELVAPEDASAFASAPSTGDVVKAVEEEVEPPALGAFVGVWANDAYHAGVVRGLDGGCAWVQVLGSGEGGLIRARYVNLEPVPESLVPLCQALLGPAKKGKA